jgi:hypothetical protein
MGILKTEAIANFLKAKAQPDLVRLYNRNMEVQVNVARDGGQRIDGDFKGRQWLGWSDGMSTWKAFRIPRNANKEPEANDSNMTYDLSAHAEGIGMTGWDWENRVSKWVAFDFDSIVNHKKALSDEEIQSLITKSLIVDWVTLRKSTSGHGIHLYVFLPDVPTRNHNEHAALARAILGSLSAVTGFDFSSKVDICGGNMWVWHRKMTPENGGLTLVHQGKILQSYPKNWKDHLKVIEGTKRKVAIEGIPTTEQKRVDDVTSQYTYVPLDDDHRKLLSYLEQKGAYWEWQADSHRLVTHTSALKLAHEDLELKGIYSTKSDGKDFGTDKNCFAFPLKRGAWAVRRFGMGIDEHASWQQDGQGWTRCYFNREPDFNTACRVHDGLEDSKGDFQFMFAEDAQKSLVSLGASIEVPNCIIGRKTIVKKHKDGSRVIVEIEADYSKDDAGKMKGWLPDKKVWRRIYNAQIETQNLDCEIGNYDDVVRHLVTEQGDDFGWVIFSDDIWRSEPLAHIKVALESLQFTVQDIKVVLGSSIFKCWTLVNRPFADEYPGDRKWNRNSAQIKYPPAKKDRDERSYPSWLKILNHCGKSLDATIEMNPWCKINGVLNGGDYLKCWIAALFQKPSEPLPYLFFHGPQNSGKSIFHEALSELMTSGVVRADTALLSKDRFNGELINAVLCVVEETNLQESKSSYNKIKDWVTSRILPVHVKFQTPYQIPNTTHWVQCANDHMYCPIFPGDTRITMCFVDSLDPLEMIDKKTLITKLISEAPDFLAEILELEIPQSSDRLAIPVIATDEKAVLAQNQRTPFDDFKETCLYYMPGVLTKFSDVWDLFYNKTLDGAARADYSKNTFHRLMPPKYPKGRVRGSSDIFFGNLSLTPPDTKIPQSAQRYVLMTDGYLMISGKDK